MNAIIIRTIHTLVQNMDRLWQINKKHRIQYRTKIEYT